MDFQPQAGRWERDEEFRKEKKKKERNILNRIDLAKKTRK